MENNSQPNILFKNFVNHQSKERKQSIKEFSALVVKKKKLFLIFLILGLLMFGIDFALKFMYGQYYDEVFLSFLGFTYILLGVFYDKIGFSGIKKATKGNKIVEELVCFSDVDIECISQIQKTNISYFAITEIAETDNSFSLFMNKLNAITLNKNNFELGTVDEFRSFIIAKTNAKYTYYSFAKRRIQKIFAIILAVVLLIGSFVIKFTSSDPTINTATFTHNEYSVTLPQDVQLDNTIENAYICVYNNDVALYVYKYSKEDAVTIFGDSYIEGATANDFAKLINDYYYREELHTNGDSSYYFKYAYTNLQNDTPYTYYYYFTYDEHNGTYYESCFAFYDKDKYAQYEAQVKEWMQSITIAD